MSLLNSFKHETYICKSVRLSSKHHSTDTPLSHCQQVNVPSGTCIESLHRPRSFCQRSSCCEDCRAIRMRAADVDRRNGDNRGCIRRRSKASFALHQGPHSFARRCNYWADPFPMLASLRRHLLIIKLESLNVAVMKKMLSIHLKLLQGQDLT